jgi:hypothetical protein
MNEVRSTNELATQQDLRGVELEVSRLIVLLQEVKETRNKRL